MKKDWLQKIIDFLVSKKASAPNKITVEVKQGCLDLDIQTLKKIIFEKTGVPTRDFSITNSGTDQITVSWVW